MSFGSDGFYTVAAVTNLKPMNPSCGYEAQWPTRRFMYYEVTIESFEGPETKAMLQLGWTVASKERNADQPSDGDGTGDFSHSWGIDGIRTIKYDEAQKLAAKYDAQISEARAELVKQFPEAATSLNTPVDDLRGPKLKEYTDAISAFWNAKAESMRQSSIVEEEITKTRRIVEKAKHKLWSRISHRRNIIAQMAVAQKKFDAKDAKEKEKGALNNMLVDRGLMCFHCIVPGAEDPDVSSAFLSDSMEATLKNPVNKQTGQPSLKWTKNSVIGVWYDSDTKEMGIVRMEQNGGKQTLFRRSDSAFFDDLNGVTWAEDDIVPCISGKGVNVKVNLGILEGESNEFKYFDSKKLAFRPPFGPNSQLFEISEIKDGKFVTAGPHNLKHGQYIRLEVSKTAITPQRKPSTSGELTVDQYTCKSHCLQNNQLVIFVEQESSSNGIEKGQVYLVHVEDEDVFSLCKVNLKERAPYRVKIKQDFPPNAFEVVVIGQEDASYISDPLQLPRVFLNGKVSRAMWGPYGDARTDVTDLYNRLYADGLRNFGNLEAVCEKDSVLYEKWGQMTTKLIDGNLKEFFKPEPVSIQASDHPEKKGVFICENHRLKKDQFVQFGKQDPPNSIIDGQAYTVNFDDVSDNTAHFRLTKFRLDETCFLSVYNALNLPDSLVGDSKLDGSGKVAKTKQKSLKYAACAPYSTPSSLTPQKVPNFAFSNGVPVMPDYAKLSDIVFCSFLPACLRSSCVELLRSCFIDQEPWFLTPPINTIRAISDEPAVPLIKFAGGYPGKTFRDFARRHNYKVGKELPELADDHFGYREDDENFFQDVYDAAGWEQSQDKDPNHFSGKNWSDGGVGLRGEQLPNIYEPLKNFLLRSYREPNAPFELSTRDIAIFWGRTSCLLWEKNLKGRFLSEKNQDIKIFLKNLIRCLLDTLRFEFDESWKGILKVRKRLVTDLELCALSYFQMTEIAHIVADAIKESQRSASSDSASETTAAMSTAERLLSCFRRSSDALIGAIRQDEANDEEQSVEVRYSSIVPQGILQQLKYVSDQSTPVAQLYNEYSRQKGSKEPYGYFDWLTLDTQIPDYKPSAFSHDQVRRTPAPF